MAIYWLISMHQLGHPKKKKHWNQDSIELAPYSTCVSSLAKADNIVETSSVDRRRKLPRFTISETFPSNSLPFLNKPKTLQLHPWYKTCFAPPSETRPSMSEYQQKDRKTMKFSDPRYFTHYIYSKLSTTVRLFKEDPRLTTEEITPYDFIHKPARKLRDLLSFETAKIKSSSASPAHSAINNRKL